MVTKPKSTKNVKGLGAKPPPRVVQKVPEPVAKPKLRRGHLQDPASPSHFREFPRGYLEAVTTTKRTFRIQLKKKVVAHFGPVDTLPSTQKVAVTYSVDDFVANKIPFSTVSVFGPYQLTEDDVPVAVVYSPEAHLVTLVSNMLSEVRDLAILDEAKMRRVDLRKKADAAVTRRIELLRRSGESKAADDLAQELKNIDVEK